MFEKCPLNEGEECPYATFSRGTLYCGLAYGENKIKDMKECPLKKKRKKKKKGSGRYIR